jgi:hypothetical protein
MSRGNPNRGTAPINLSNFNNRKKFQVTYNIEQSGFVTNWQLNKRTLGSEINPLWGNLVPSAGTAGESNFDQAQVRIIKLKLMFDNRAGIAGTFPAANYRVAAFIVPLTEAQLDPSFDTNLLGQFGLNGVNLQRTKTIHLRIGPEFPIGRFGLANSEDSRLLIFSDGFSGNVRVQVTYEVCGFPAITFNP